MPQAHFSRRNPARKSQIESLEPRQLLSVSTASWTSAQLTTGTNWETRVTDPDTGNTVRYKSNVVGPTTFNGHAAVEVDTSTDAGGSFQPLSKVYLGTSPGGDLVMFGVHATIGSAVQDDTFTPYQVILPGMLTAGQTVTFTDTDHYVLNNTSGTTDRINTDTIKFTLASETPSPITVPAGTFDCYQITQIDSSQGDDGSSSGPDTTQYWYAPQVGTVKSIDEDGTISELLSFNGGIDHLVFSAAMPAKTPANQTLPSFTVSALDQQNHVDTDATGSVTLSFVSFPRAGSGTLQGTTTRPLVNGVATFNDISVSADGNYILQATDTNGDTATQSNEFRIGGNLTVEINSRDSGTEAGVKPGDTILYSILATPNQPLQAQTLVATLPNGFAPRHITGNGVFSGNTITWTNTSLRAANFDVKVPDAEAMKGLKNVVVSVDDQVTYVDNTTDGGAATSTTKIALPSALDFLQSPKNMAAGQIMAPAVTVAVRDIYGEIDTESTDTIELRIRNGKGKLEGTVTATAVNGIATFSDLKIAQTGFFRLQAVDVTAPKIKPALSEPFAEVGLKQIVLPLGKKKHVSQDRSLEITNGNAVAVLQSLDSLALMGRKPSSGLPEITANMKWVAVRNSADIATGNDPIIAAGTSPLDVTVNLNGAVGSFNLICYYDTNTNNALDATEELCVFHLAVVAARILPGGSTVTSTESFTGGDSEKENNSAIVSGSFSGNHWGILQTQTIQVIGGGSDGMIGVDRVHFGWLQNGIGDTVAVTYDNGTVLHETIGRHPFPVLDSNFKVGGIGVYQKTAEQFSSGIEWDAPGPRRDPVVGANPNGGENRFVQTGDSPSVKFKTFLGKARSVSTSGSNYFVDYLAGFSDDFVDQYVGFYKVDWQATFNLVHGSDNTWSNNGSTIVATESDLNGGRALAALGVATKTPRFVDLVEVR